MWKDGTASSDDDLLTCWKDIANYLGKGVRTVQRWEQIHGLPVRRPRGAKAKSAVVAHTTDLDAWLESNWLERNRQNGHVGIVNVMADDLAKLLREVEELRRKSEQVAADAKQLIEISADLRKVIKEQQSSRRKHDAEAQQR